MTLTLEQRWLQKLQPPSFFLNTSVARLNFPLRSGAFLEPSKRDGTLDVEIFEIVQPVIKYVIGREDGADDFLVKM